MSQLDSPLRTARVWFSESGLLVFVKGFDFIRRKQIMIFSLPIKLKMSELDVVLVNPDFFFLNHLRLFANPPTGRLFSPVHHPAECCVSVNVVTLGACVCARLCVRRRRNRAHAVISVGSLLPPAGTSCVFTAPTINGF